MALKGAKETVREMLALCYNEDYPELHNELLSIERSLKGCKDSNAFETAMQEILSTVQLFTDDFPEDIFAELEQLFETFIEEND